MKLFGNPAYSKFLAARRAKVGVIGLGTVGLPVATLFGLKGFPVIGYDINPKRTNDIRQGRVKLPHTERLRTLIEKGRIVVEDGAENLMRSADVVIISVPTPLKPDREPDLRFVKSATLTVGKGLRPGQIVVYESTMPIGGTREMSSVLENESGLKCSLDFGVGVAPERYVPSTLTPIARISSARRAPPERFPLEFIPRVVSGIDPNSAKIVRSIYRIVIESKVVMVSSPEVAEASKLVENTFRNVNIALVNEISKLLSRMGLDTFEVVDAAKSKPFAFMAHYPGLGVGGECIPVVPWLLISSAKDLKLDLPLVQLACETNENMPLEIKRMLVSKLRGVGKSIGNCKVAILGLCYKKDFPDSRLSPAVVLGETLKALGATVAISDPVLGEGASTGLKLVRVEEAVQHADALVLATDHEAFRKLDLNVIKMRMNPKPVLIDTRNFFSSSTCTQLGFVYAGVGKPAN